MNTIYITYEIINDDLILKIEYVWLRFDEPAIYSIDRISFTIDNETINKYLPNIYKVLKQMILLSLVNHLCAPRCCIPYGRSTTSDLSCFNFIVTIAGSIKLFLGHQI